MSINFLLKSFTTLQNRLIKFIESQSKKVEAKEAKLNKAKGELQLAKSLKTKVDDILDVTA